MWGCGRRRAAPAKSRAEHRTERGLFQLCCDEIIYTQDMLRSVRRILVRGVNAPPLAARGEENFENLTTNWCILRANGREQTHQNGGASALPQTLIRPCRQRRNSWCFADDEIDFVIRRHRSTPEREMRHTIYSREVKSRAERRTERGLF